MTEPSSGQSPPPVDREQANRIWQHALHEDTLYQQRLSSFTLIEAVLLGFFGNAYSRGNSEPFVWYVAILSLCFSALWLFMQYRHWAYLTHVTKRVQQFAPEFKATLGTFPHFWLWRFDTPRLMALAIPALFIVTWTALLGWMLLRPAEETPNSFGISFDRFLISIVIAVVIWFFIRLRKIEKLFLTPAASSSTPKSSNSPLTLRSEIKPKIVVAEKSHEVESSSGN